VENITDLAFPLVAVVVGGFEAVVGIVGVDFLLTACHDLLNQPLGFSKMADKLLNGIDRNKPLEVVEIGVVVVSHERGDSGVNSGLSFRGVAGGAGGFIIISDRLGSRFANRLFFDSRFGRGRRSGRVLST
jgi:hypothetical protein